MTFRAILLNDARAEEHIGCKLVVKNILEQCSRVGIKVVDTVAHSATDDEAITREKLADYDLLLINGEGTMHHDQPKALSLMRSAISASKRGKMVVLINTVWQHNQQLNQMLPHLDLVYCREPLSGESIRSAGCDARVVPDMVFATGIGCLELTTDRAGIAVIDSVNRDTTMRWAWAAARGGYAFLPMHRASYDRLVRRPWLCLCFRAWSGRPLVATQTDFLGELARYEAIISGRFHAACLAFLLGIPVVGVSSNTHKIEGLFRAAGLGDQAIVSAEDQVQQSLDYVRSRNSDVGHYVADARRRIALMFDEIHAVASAKTAA